jgi:hypothetical protein
MKGCQQYTVYMAAERDGLRQAMAANRQWMSLQAGHEVPEAVAVQDFLDHLFIPFACQFRLNYCRACPLANRCDVAQRTGRL